MESAGERRLDALMAVLRGARARHVRTLAAVRAGWVGLALALGLAAADLLLAPSAPWRVLLDVAVAVAVWRAAVAVRRRHLSAASLDRMLARLLEEGRRETDNAVVNALDFEDRLAAPPDPHVSQALMRRQIEEAARRLAGESGRDTLRPPGIRLERRILLGLGAACLVLAAAAPQAVLTVLPRYLLPFLDVPPYCLTRFEVTPGHAGADYGGSLDVAVKTLGRRPRSIRLVLETRSPRERTELPLYESERDTYRQTLEPVVSDLVYYAEVPGGRSRYYKVKVSKVPRIDSVRATFDYPAYTHLRPVTRLLGPDPELKGYAGTRVTLQLTSNRELAGGTMTLGGKPVEVRKSEQPNTVEAVFAIGEPGGFEITVADPDGLACAAPVRGRVVVTPDEKPRVAAVSPETESLATPRARIPINVEAGDDLGVRRVTMYRNVNGSADSGKTLYEGPGRAAFVNVIETFDLADLGVKPGDVIDYYLDATDTRPGAPQTESSPACRLTIISEEDYAELVRTLNTGDALREKYEQFMEEWKTMADEQERLREETAALTAEAAKGALDEDAKRRLQDLADRQNALAGRAREAAERLDREAKTAAVYDVEKDYKELLKELARKLEKGAFHMETAGPALAKASGGQGAGSASDLAKALGQQEEALDDLSGGEKAYQEQIAKANREIEKLHALYADAEAFKTLLDRQKEVVRKIHSYKGQALSEDGKTRVRELAAEQDEIRGKLTALKERLREHAKPVQADYPKVAGDAEAIASSIEKLGIEGLMKNAGGELGKPDVPPGAAAAEEAYDRMLSMVGQCQAGGEGAQAECEARLRLQMSMGLGRTFQQMSMGRGQGVGGSGGMGQGSDSGGSSARMPFGLYGSSELNGPKARATTGMGRGGEAEETLPDPAVSRFAMGSEERVEKRSGGPQVELPAGEAIMEEYRPLILQYFRRAQEEP